MISKLGTGLHRLHIIYQQRIPEQRAEREHTCLNEKLECDLEIYNDNDFWFHFVFENIKKSIIDKKIANHEYVLIVSFGFRFSWIFGWICDLKSEFILCVNDWFSFRIKLHFQSTYLFKKRFKNISSVFWLRLKLNQLNSLKFDVFLTAQKDWLC